MTPRSLLPLLFVVLAACGGRSHETREGSSGSGARAAPDDVMNTPSGAAAGESTSGGASGAGGTDAAGAPLGGTAGAAGQGGNSGDGGQSGPPLAGAGGEPGECSEKPYGELTAAQTAGDCNKTICDGAGTAQEVLDPSDLPEAPDGCTVPVCTNAGPSSVASPPGTACDWAVGVGVCDGHGTCYECLNNEDCTPGKVCGSHTCQDLGSCADTTQNGQETGVDCGGPDCGACADGKTCLINQDCKSDLCDPLFHTCLPDSCRNGKQDNDETDVDCGGKTCAGCYVLKKCLVDSDCATQKCNTDKGTCGGSACNDKRQDGLETDIDCGGYECAQCVENEKCHYGFDCLTGVCSHATSPPRCL